MLSVDYLRGIVFLNPWIEVDIFFIVRKLLCDVLLFLGDPVPRFSYYLLCLLLMILIVAHANDVFSLIPVNELKFFFTIVNCSPFVILNL